jgi:probable phosphoglycerate mutase
MHEHQPEAAKIWASRDPDGVIHEGEPLGPFHRRVVRAINDIAARHTGQRVMVVSHGGAMDIIWREANQLSLQADRHAPIVNTSVNRIAVSEDGWKVIDWGDVRHLDGSSLDDVTA